MLRLNKRTIRATGIVLLSAYSLLVCEEVFHTHAVIECRGALALNEATHKGNGVAPADAKECPICQSAASQIYTETFLAETIALSYILHTGSPLINPSIRRFDSFSHRAPPAAA